LRSEERAGLVAAALLLLWGTVLTFPLHRFTTFLEDAGAAAVDLLPASVPFFVRGLILVVLLTAAELLLLFVSGTGFACFIPAAAFLMTTVFFCVRCIRTGVFGAAEGICLAAVLTVLAVLHFFKAEKILLWITDITIFSISAHLLASIVAAPLAAAYPALKTVLYITHYDDTFIGESFGGFLTLPAFVWGIFFMIIFTLPVIYYSFSRKKA